MKSRMAAGYNNELTPIPSEWHFGVLQSAGAFSSTANDLLKFLGAVLGFKQSPLQPAMKSMLDIRRPGGMQPSTQIALAWNVYIDGEQEVVWKNGSVGGYRSFIGFDPKAGVLSAPTTSACICSTNTFRSTCTFPSLTKKSLSGPKFWIVTLDATSFLRPIS